MSNLQEFHHTQEAPDRRSQMVVAAIIAAVMIGFGIYIYEEMWNPTTHTIVTDSQLPAH
ncbi:MAG TPA: hypothetical protein VGC16_10675 [Rhizomicrobium sp.]